MAGAETGSGSGTDAGAGGGGGGVTLGSGAHADLIGGGAGCNTVSEFEIVKADLALEGIVEAEVEVVVEVLAAGRLLG